MSPVEPDISALEARFQALGIDIREALSVDADTETLELRVAVDAVALTDPYHGERDSAGMLDHQNRRHLRWAYEHHETISAAAAEFAVGYPTIHYQLVKRGIHDVESYNTTDKSDNADDTGEGASA